MNKKVLVTSALVLIILGSYLYYRHLQVADVFVPEPTAPAGYNVQ